MSDVQASMLPPVERMMNRWSKIPPGSVQSAKVEGAENSVKGVETSEKVAAKHAEAPANLTTPERKTLADCEAVIEQGLHTFVDVGRALAQIRDGRLYRAAHSTFADYCRVRWDISRDYAYKQIDAAAVQGHLSTIVDILPATESQCRPLTKLRTANSDGEKVIDLETVREVWQRVLDEAPQKDGKPAITAAHVEEAVSERCPKEPQEATVPQTKRIPMATLVKARDTVLDLKKYVQQDQMIVSLVHVRQQLEAIGQAMLRLAPEETETN